MSNGEFTYDIVNPIKKISMTDKFTIEKSVNKTLFNNCLLEENTSIGVGEKWRELKLGRWNKGDGDNFSFHMVKDENECLWELFTLLIEDYTGNSITKNELLKTLISGYNKYFNKGNKDTIKKIFIKEGKKTIVNQMKEGINLDLIFTFDNYWITVFDIILISLIFELPIVLFSSTKIPSLYCNTKILGSNEKNFYYLLKISRLSTQKKTPKIGILKYKKDPKIKTIHFKTAKDELFKNGNIDNIDNFYTNFLQNFLIEKKKFKKMKQKKMKQKMKLESSK